MAQLLATPQEQQIEERKYGALDWWGGWRTMWVGMGGLAFLFIIVRVYQHLFALTEGGFGSSTGQFRSYWWSLWASHLVSVTVGSLAFWWYLIKSGAKLEASGQMVDVSHEEEMRRMAVFWGFIGMISIIAFFEASFFPHQDASWHQTLVRDTALTPNHIPMFYLVFPLGITFSVGAYLYGRTRLPKVYGAENGFPWSFFLLISAYVLEFVQVALNEWGHSLWVTEEVFSAVLHWPFVWYGWLAASLFALWAEGITRILHTEEEIMAEQGEA